LWHQRHQSRASLVLGNFTLAICNRADKPYLYSWSNEIPSSYSRANKRQESRAK
jgi:hypothetical protein